MNEQYKSGVQKFFKSLNFDCHPSDEPFLMFRDYEAQWLLIDGDVTLPMLKSIVAAWEEFQRQLVILVPPPPPAHLP